MSSNPFRIALIGCGDHARQQHAATLSRWAAEHPGKISLVAACDPDQDRAADVCRQFGFADAFDDMRQMLDRASPDACAAIPPMHLNASIGAELLERKIPCIIEKPPGVTIEEANALADVARRTGTPHLISMNRRFNPHLNRAANWFKSIGAIRRVHASMFRIDRREPEFIWATGIHAIDTVRYLAGEITTSTSRYDTSRSGRRYLIDIEFSDAVQGQIDIQPERNTIEETYELFGDTHHASISIDAVGRVRTRGWFESKLTFDNISAEDEADFITCGAYAETDHFITALLAGSATKPTIEDVLPSAELAFGAHR